MKTFTSVLDVYKRQAMKYLVPMARVSPEDCVRMASALVLSLIHI